MLDHATLSASQGSLAHSSSKNHSRDTDKTPIVVSDLSATLDKLHRNSFAMQFNTQDRLEIASSIAIAKISEARNSLQEKGNTSFFLFVGQLRLLEQRYTLRERDDILRLLEKYPYLSLFLLEIHRQIVPYFPIAQIFLKAIIDPEATDEFEASDENENLIISVVTHMQPREALDRLKQFYKDWWLKTPNRAKVKEKISFNLECV